MFYSDFLGSNLTIMTRFCDEKVPEHGHKGKMVSKWWDIILFYYYSTNAYFRHRLHLWVVTMGREMGRHLRCHTSQATSQAYSMVYFFFFYFQNFLILINFLAVYLDHFNGLDHHHHFHHYLCHLDASNNHQTLTLTCWLPQRQQWQQGTETWNVLSPRCPNNSLYCRLDLRYIYMSFCFHSTLYILFYFRFY